MGVYPLNAESNTLQVQSEWRAEGYSTIGNKFAVPANPTVDPYRAILKLSIVHQLTPIKACLVGGQLVAPGNLLSCRKWSFYCICPVSTAFTLLHCTGGNEIPMQILSHEECVGVPLDSLSFLEFEFGDKMPLPVPQEIPQPMPFPKPAPLVDSIISAPSPVPVDLTTKGNDFIEGSPSPTPTPSPATTPTPSPDEEQLFPDIQQPSQSLLILPNPDNVEVIYDDQLAESYTIFEANALVSWLNTECGPTG